MRRPLLALGSCAFVLLVGGCRNSAGPPSPAVADPTSAATSGRLDEPAGEPGGASGADVVLVTLDTLRYDALGVHGNQRAQTPVLDRLARSGRRFERAHAHNVVTLPSHVNILTGLLPYQHGVRDNGGFTVPEDVPTLAHLLGAAGYATAAFVGAFPLDARFGLGRGFDLYDDAYARGAASDQFRFAERPGSEVVERALSWWQSARERPRFLWVHLYDPHAPYAPPEPWASRFRDAPYLGEVAATDTYLAPLLEPLAAPDARPAVVVVTADHGEALGDHGELTHGLFAYQETLRVPLILWGAGVRRGVDGRTVGHVDLVPTILDLLGLPTPDGLPGSSLARVERADRRHYFEALSTYYNRGWAPLRGVLEGDTKLVSLPLPELYDLGADPEEEHNLVDRERRRVHALRQALPEEEVWPPSPRSLGEEETRQLRSLGYLAGGGTRPTTFGPEDDPKNLREVDSQMHRTIDAYSRGDLTEAARLGRQVVERRPRMAVGYEVLGLVLRSQGRHAEALALMRQGLDAGLSDPALLRQYAMALAEAGRPREAVEVLEPLAAGDREPATWNALGAAFSEIGRHDDAVSALRRAAALDPKDPKPYENLGIAYLRVRQPQESLRHLQRALEINPSLPISWNTLGVALSFLGRPREAVEAWEKAVALDPRQLDALYNLGLTSAQLGDRERARRALERFVATAPPTAAADVARARQVLGSLAP